MSYLIMVRNSNTKEVRYSACFYHECEVNHFLKEMSVRDNEEVIVKEITSKSVDYYRYNPLTGEYKYLPLECSIL